MYNWLRRFMAGRYGGDQLNTALFILLILLMITKWFVHSKILSVVMFVVLCICYFRILSRNITARYAENQKFLSVWLPMQQKLWPLYVRLQHKRRMKCQQFADRKEHRYLKCPSCKATLRVPRHRGKIRVNCPKCGNQFVTKS